MLFVLSLTLDTSIKSQVPTLTITPTVSSEKTVTKVPIL